MTNATTTTPTIHDCKGCGIPIWHGGYCLVCIDKWRKEHNATWQFDPQHEEWTRQTGPNTWQIVKADFTDPPTF